MDYRNLNDNELVYLCRECNEDATTLLIDKYRNCIVLILKDYLNDYNILGMEVADLYQEGLIGLIHAINSFDDKRDVTFYTYANTCIRSSIMSSMRQTFRMKNRVLNNSYSLDKLFEESNNNLYDIFTDEESNPAKVIMNEEEQNELINKMRDNLSKSEKTVFDLKLKGLSNNEIATLMDKNKKFVENVMYRINKKYKELF